MDGMIDFNAIGFFGIVGFQNISISLRVAKPFWANKNSKEKHESVETP
jgi:hypothetical protein